MRFDLIVFDCDGVLVDSEPIVNRVFVEMLGELGFSLDYEQGLARVCRPLHGEPAGGHRAPPRWSAPPDFVPAFDRRLVRAMERELKPVPDIAEALAALDGRWCVVSNGTHQEMRARLRLVGLLQHFEPHLFSTTEVARSKPAPDVYPHAADRMGVEPARCAAIEDSPTGVQAAVRAGMTVLGYARLTSPRVLRDTGAQVFEDMSELPRLLGSTA